MNTKKPPKELPEDSPDWDTRFRAFVEARQAKD